MPQRRGLTRAEILAAALDLADDEGLPAVSMRSVAQRLGVTPMALYRHVGDKEALLDGLVELLLADADAGSPDAGSPEDQDGPGWLAVLRGRAAALRATARRHPEAFALVLARRAGTPAALQARDQVLEALHAAGVPADDVPRLERLLSTFVIGFAASEANGRFSDRARADADFAYAETLLRQVVTAGAQSRRVGGGAP